LLRKNVFKVRCLLFYSDFYLMLSINYFFEFLDGFMS
jgi:hypothetical protein